MNWIEKIGRDGLVTICWGCGQGCSLEKEGVSGRGLHSDVTVGVWSRVCLENILMCFSGCGRGCGLEKEPALKKGGGLRVAI